MIDTDGHMVVYLAVIDHGPDEGGDEVISVHDTHEGAIRSLKSVGFRSTTTLGFCGAVYVYHEQTIEEYPRGYVQKMEVGE